MCNHRAHGEIHRGHGDFYSSKNSFWFFYPRLHGCKSSYWFLVACYSQPGTRNLVHIPRRGPFGVCVSVVIRVHLWLKLDWGLFLCGLSAFSVASPKGVPLGCGYR